ncbi:MAG TPA: type II toxin-antitoxin system death-on-curing family toxin [Chloroflexota bacterium]
MTEDILYLDVDDVLRLHARIFDMDPGAARDRLRDAPALESALGRPIHHATYGDADIAMQAAILAHGVAQSQSFLDGNKRTALITMATFLALNGWGVDVPDPRPAQLIIDFAADAPADVLADELRGGLLPRS